MLGGRGGLYIRPRRNYVPPHLNPSEITEREEYAMRAEMLNVVDEIKQAISLLRRHL
ncbi:hypothetical protein GCM10010924_03440 [Rhizobium wenxiniae]|nr:hypothetical protein GCM10010924_03440 [Rhizobium wenxiniae]